MRHGDPATGPCLFFCQYAIFKSAVENYAVKIVLWSKGDKNEKIFGWNIGDSWFGYNL